MGTEVYKARSAVALAVQRGKPSEDARRDLAAAKLAQYVERVVAEAPPLTDEQVNRIARLLRPATGEAHRG
ncbi:UNVERIFIED_ORG: hypothetical protein J2X79_000241 [Arthrobacter globiformis]|nr:hypothetical protein [Arthrobacter globiformis]